MNIIFLMIVLKPIQCLLTKQTISKINKKIILDDSLECSIINPFFGYIFWKEMLFNLRSYYYNIIPQYKNDNSRNYIFDKESDCLSYVLINLFPSFEEDITLTFEGTGNDIKKYFIDFKTREIAIKSFGLLFANIVNLEKNFRKYQADHYDVNSYVKFLTNNLSNKLKDIFYKTKQCNNDKEHLSLILLTIHSFMLDVLENEEEYTLYLSTLLDNIKKESIFRQNELFLNKIELKKDGDFSSVKLMKTLYSYDTDMIKYYTINLSDNNDSILSPIEYIVVKYIYGITGKDINYKKTQLDLLYNGVDINNNEHQEEYLYNLYKDCKENNIDMNLIKLTKMIIKTDISLDKNIKDIFFPFYPLINDYENFELSKSKKITIWLDLIQKFEFQTNDHFIMQVWTKEVENLDFNDNFFKSIKFNNQGLLNICKVLSNTNIRCLDIETKNQEKYDWVDIFDLLKKCLDLECVTIRSREFDFKDRLCFYDFISYKINTISYLDVSRLNISIEDIKLISKIISAKDNKIYTLDLTKNRLGPDSIKMLMDALKNKNNKITHLYLDYNNIRSEGVSYLSYALMHKNNKINHLSIGGNEVEFEGAMYLCDALTNENNKISHLYLNNNYLRLAGIKQISDALKNVNNKITHLNVSKNNAGDVGLLYLSDMLRNNNNKLKNLDISSNKITEVGAQYIFDKLNNINCKLHSLTLSYTKIEQDSLVDFSTINDQCQSKRSTLVWCILGQKELNKMKEKIIEKQTII